MSLGYCMSGFKNPTALYVTCPLNHTRLFPTPLGESTLADRNSTVMWTLPPRLFRCSR